MEEIETEVVEEEVRRIYCDECGDECTDDHNHVRRELCNGCTDLTAAERVGREMPRVVPQKASAQEASTGQLITSVLVYPIVFIVMVIGNIRPDHKIESADRRLLLTNIAGTALYTALVTGVVLMLL